MKTTLTRVALGLVLGACVGTVAADQAPPAKPQPAKAKDRGAELDARLKERLENLGYEPELMKLKGGRQGYRLRFTKDNFSYVMWLAYNNGNTNLWFNAALRQLPKEADTRRDILEQLLQKNDDIGPAHFALKSNRWLYLSMAMAASEASPARLQGWFASNPFTGRDALSKEETSRASVYGWLTELHRHGTLVQVEEARGRKPAVWRCGPDQAAGGILPDEAKVFASQECCF
jgi:hypothetical protein